MHRLKDCGASRPLCLLYRFGRGPNLLEAHLAAKGLDINAGHFSKTGTALQPPESGMKNSANGRFADLAERVGLIPACGLHPCGAALRAVCAASRRSNFVLIPHPRIGIRFAGFVAERVGFEPTGPCGPPVFKTGALDHSATSPVGSRTNAPPGSGRQTDFAKSQRRASMARSMSTAFTASETKASPRLWRRTKRIAPAWNFLSFWSAVRIDSVEMSAGRFWGRL